MADLPVSPPPRSPLTFPPAVPPRATATGASHWKAYGGGAALGAVAGYLMRSKGTMMAVGIALVVAVVAALVLMYGLGW